MQLDSIIKEYGIKFEQNAEKADTENNFVLENLKSLKREGVHKMLVPKALGGSGISYSELCDFIKKLATFCPSTALTLSMHQHLVAVLVFKHNNGDESATHTLKLIADKDIALLSTGGGDWLSSNGTAKKVDGGYLINCRKSFCSGAQLADVVITSCAFKDEEKETVLHFSSPMNIDGITIIDDWDSMGMRGTGSCSVEFKDVFIPDEKIALQRPRGVWHPALNLTSTFVFPIINSVYAGITEALCNKTIELLTGRKGIASHSLASLGEMKNHQKITQWAHKQLVENANNLQVTPNEQTASEAHQAKSLLSQHARECAQSAMEAVGGYSYYKRAGIERLYRDLLAGEFHPISAGKQRESLGGFLLGRSLAG